MFFDKKIQKVADEKKISPEGETVLRELQKDFKRYNEHIASVRDEPPFIEIYPEYKEWYESL